MRKVLVIVSSVLFVASVLALAQAYRLPVEVQTERQVTLLSYRHEGELTPRVYVKPGYLYTGTPLPEETVRYPLSLIERFDMSFIYEADAETSWQAEVKAVLESPGMWQKTISLVDLREGVGDLRLDFSLDLAGLQSLARSIDDVMGVGARTYNISITAAVYPQGDTTGVSTDFNHTLPLVISQNFVEVSGGLTKRWGDSVGRFDYAVYLGPNPLFGATILTPPPSPAPELLPSGEVAFSRLVEGIDVQFCYHFKSDEPIGEVEEVVTLDAVVESPGKWSKTFVLVPPTEKSGDFTLTVPLDLEQYHQVFETITSESGVSASTRKLSIEAEVHTLGQTELGTINETFSQSISTDLGAGELEWVGEQKKSVPGSITRSEVVRQENTYRGLPVARLRTICLIVVGVFSVLFIVSLALYARRREIHLPAVEVEREARRAAKKYKDVIVTVKELPPLKAEETVLSLDSVDDVVRLAEGLLRPVLHQEEEGRHIYCVLGDNIRHQYVLSPEPAEELLSFNHLTED